MTITFTEVVKKIINGLALLVFFTLPFERIPTVEFSGFTIKISYVFALILCLVFVANKPLSFFAKNKFYTSDYFLVLFFISSLISLTFSPDLQRSLVIILLWLFVFLLYLVFSRCLLDSKLREKLFSAILFSSCLVCIFGLFQFVGDSLNLPVSVTGLRLQYTKIVLGFPRIQSVALEPLYFANFLLVPFFISLVRYVRNRELFKGYFLLSILILVSIILTISRGAYIALIVSLILFFLYLILNRKKENYQNKLFGIVIILTVSIVLSLGMIYRLNGKSSGENFLEHSIVENAQEDGSANDRLTTYKIAYDLFKSQPVFGNAPGGFGVLTKKSDESVKEKGYGTVNNEYLEILAENGLIGLILFLLFLGFYFVEIWPNFKSRNESNKLMIVGLFSGIVGIFIQYNFFSTLYIIYIWAFLALLKSLSANNLGTEK